jgi:D-sedoheptulose 7-phosphate isomerase
VESTHDRIERALSDHLAVFHALTGEHKSLIAQMAQAWADALQGGAKVLLFGNGGSAADSQHIAAELVGRFARERRALPAVALTVNTSNLTAIANDYSYDEVFARQVEAMGRPGDVAVGISTSGNSPNVVKALERAKGAGLTTQAWTGQKGGRCAEVAHHAFRAPSNDTPRIQELHITVGHIVCDLVEEQLFGARA